MSSTATAVVVAEPDAQLEVLDEIEHRLTQMDSVPEVKEIADQAAALLHYAKAAKKGLAVQNRCAWIKVCAERRTGQLLLDMADRGEREGRGGDRKSNSSGASLKLEDLGIGFDKSARWQRLARFPMEELEQMRAQCEIDEEEMSSARVDREVRRWCRAQEADAEEAAWLERGPAAQVHAAIGWLLKWGYHTLDSGTPEDERLHRLLRDRTYCHRTHLEKVQHALWTLRRRVDLALDALRERLKLQEVLAKQLDSELDTAQASGYLDRLLAERKKMRDELAAAGNPEPEVDDITAGTGVWHTLAALKQENALKQAPATVLTGDEIDAPP